MIGSSDDSRMARFRAWASARAASRSGCSSTGRWKNTRQVGRPPSSDFSRNSLVWTSISSPVCTLRSRLRPSQRPVLLTAGTATSRSSAHDSSAYNSRRVTDGVGGRVVQAHQSLPGRIQIERLAVRSGQQDEIGGGIGQDASQRLGAGVEQIRPFAHYPAPPTVRSLPNT